MNVIQTISVLPCDTKVVLNISNNTGIITGICIRGLEVSYEIGNYEGGVYKTVWLRKSQFEPVNILDTGEVLIGFITEGVKEWM